MQKAVCEMDAIPKLAQIISVMEDGDLMYGIVDQRDKLKEVSVESTPLYSCRM